MRHRSKTERHERDQLTHLRILVNLKQNNNKEIILTHSIVKVLKTKHKETI